MFDLQMGIRAFLICITLISFRTTELAGQTPKLNGKPNEIALEWSKDALTEAMVSFEEAATSWRSAQEMEHASACLREAAKLAQILSNYEKGSEYLRRALRYDTSIENIAGQAISHSLYSLLLAQSGDNSAAEREYIAAFQLIDQTDSAEAKANAFFSAGLYDFYHGNIKQTLDHFEKADFFARESDDVSLKIQIQMYIGFTKIRLGDPISGSENMELAFNESRRSNNPRDQALSLFSIGFAAMQRGEKQKAIEYFSRAEELFPKDFEWLERGKLYSNVGWIFEEHGSVELAAQSYQKGYEYYGLARFPLGQLALMPELANINYKGGKKSEAIELYNQALTLAKHLNDRFRVAVIYEGLADIAFDDSSFQNAITLYLEASQIYDEMNSRLPRLDRNLGRAYEALGNYALAGRYYQASLAANRKARDSLSVAQNLHDLAQLELKIGQPSKAIDFLLESRDLTERGFLDLSNKGLRSSFFSSAYERYQLLVKLRMDLAKTNEISAREALVDFERSKCRLMLEGLTLTETNLTADSDPVSLHDEENLKISLNAKSDILTETLGSDPSSPEVIRLEAEILDLRNQLDEMRGRLRQSSPIYSAIKNPEPFDVADFQANVLGQDDLLLEFSLGREESYLWAVDRSDVTAYYLPPREQIEARVDRLRELLGSRQLEPGETFEDYQRRMADAEIEYKAEARILSNALLGQVPVDKLAGKRLIVVADGRLNYFPLGSLPMPGVASDDPILLTNEIVYEPSASALKIFRMERRIEAKPQKDLLVFADPVFSRSDERIAGLDTSNRGLVSMILPTFRSIESLESMPRLPASEDEAKSISDVVGANQTTVRAGFAASRDGVLNGGIEDYKILHFATHGLIDEKRPELSGILLSLFNDEGKANDGGFIRLQDVYGLRLNSDLVVLSACDTGIGKEIKGEGVMSLNNAFLQAGAKSVVSSLWKVDDNATKDLMTEFYRGMADDNLTAAAALRHAQIKMYNDSRYRSPFYWAAFTASGDTGVKVAFTSYAWLYAIIAAAVVFAAALSFFAFRRLSRRRRAEKLRFSVTG